ncbi:MAG TPA: hypothetical protein VFA85_17415 [Terriglobales bacterium]|nr:hypothetical protein [Terriglobales bacterium]
MSNRFLEELASLTREEFTALWKSGAFTGFTEQDMAEANETDREKMRLTNEALRLATEAKRLEERRRNLGQ